MTDNKLEVKGYLQRKKENEGEPQGKETHPVRRKLTHNSASGQHRELAHVVTPVYLFSGVF